MKGFTWHFVRRIFLKRVQVAWGSGKKTWGLKSEDCTAPFCYCRPYWTWQSVWVKPNLGGWPRWRLSSCLAIASTVRCAAMTWTRRRASCACVTLRVASCCAFCPVCMSFMPSVLTSDSRCVGGLCVCVCMSFKPSVLTSGSGCVMWWWCVCVCVCVGARVLVCACKMKFCSRQWSVLIVSFSYSEFMLKRSKSHDLSHFIFRRLHCNLIAFFFFKWCRIHNLTAFSQSLYTNMTKTKS